ncbi:MAG TPA: hypothetical protein VEI53_11040 [Ktedonobacteraceae bacterium]|nr:hypothetical protein [Ktedonobacteraceae bacterium]
MLQWTPLPPLMIPPRYDGGALPASGVLACAESVPAFEREPFLMASEKAG